MNKTELIRHCFHLADRVFQARPWQTLTEEQLLVFELPGEPHPVAVSITGQTTDDFGLRALTGPHALLDLARIAQDRVEPEAVGSPVLGVVLVPRDAIERPWLEMLERAGWQRRAAPMFFALSAGKRRPPDREALLRLGFVLAGLARVCAQHQLHALAAVGRDDVGLAPLISVSGSLVRPEVALGARRLAQTARGHRDPADASLSGPSRATAASEAAEPVDLERIPGDDDLPAWKALDAAAGERLLQAVARAIPNARALSMRYFGHDPLEASGDGASMMLSAFFDWLAFDHRAGKRAPTPVERMLEGPLPAGLRAIIEARRRATPSIYRIQRITAGESVDVVDVLGGEELTIADRMMSLSAREGQASVLRIHAAGAFRFASVAGPVFSAVQCEAALAFLRTTCGFDFADEDARRRKSHLIGRLWSWAKLEAQRGLPRLQNTDGHELRPCTATFAVADPGACIAAIDADPEIEQGPDDTRVWFDTRGVGGGHRVLGRLELHGAELLLDVNSAERLEAARLKLERIDGVRFVRVVEHELDAGPSQDRPLDDRLPRLDDEPEDLDEVRREVQQLIDAQCMAWLDESIPMLGGKTPREACATEDGRRTVARLIRTYPDPGGIDGVTIPRERMMAELALD